MLLAENSMIEGQEFGVFPQCLLITCANCGMVFNVSMPSQLSIAGQGSIVGLILVSSFL